MCWDCRSSRRLASRGRSSVGVLRRLGRCGAAALLVLSTLLPVGCGDSFRTAGELDDNPQVLAVRAEPPDVTAGEMVALDALVHWPGGDPTLAWLVCVPQVGDTLSTCLQSAFAASEGAPPLCDVAPPGTRFCLAGVGNQVSYTVPRGVFPDDGETHTIFVNLLASASPDGLVACADVLAGGPSTGDCLLALKRVAVGPGPAWNQNPRIAGVTLGGAPLGASDPIVLSTVGRDMGSFSLRMGVQVDATSVDELFPTDGDPAPVKLVASWFADCGTLDPERSFVPCDPGVPAELPDVPAEPPSCDLSEVDWNPGQSGTCHLHVVVRDGRGGTDFVSRTVRLGGTS